MKYWEIIADKLSAARTRMIRALIPKSEPVLSDRSTEKSVAKARRRVSSGLPREYDSIAAEIQRGPTPEWR